MIKTQKNLVMIIGHKFPHYLIDTADSIRHFNTRNNYDIVFAIDANIECASTLRNKYGHQKVFVTNEQNGWGRGILRTIIHAFDYFKPLHYRHIITMDSDALCVGPFVSQMLEFAEESDVFFVGTIWHSPHKDHGFHYTLRASGFMNEYPWHFKTEMAAGPCMLWTAQCLKFLYTIGLRPAFSFDQRYPMIHFAHDQISTYLNSCSAGKIQGLPHNIMEIKWREPLPTFKSTFWGEIPLTYNHTAIIHPTESSRYSESKVRDYFKLKRENPNL